MKIQGLDEFTKILEKSQDSYKKEAKKLLNGIGMKLKKRVVSRTPVDTGVLKQSWKYETIDENEGILSNNVHYASDVEYGHRTRGRKSFVDGVYMLEKSVKEIETELDKEFSIMIDNLFK